MGRKSTDKVRQNNPRKRKALAEQLIPMLQGRSLRGMTMDDLAGLLGKSKATIYKYFDSREALFELALSLKLEKIRGFVPILQDQQRPFLERYHEAIQHLGAHLADISNVFLADLKTAFHTLWQKIRFFQDMAAMILKAYYEEGVAKGILKPIHPGILVASDQFMFEVLTDPEFLEANGLTVKGAFEQYFQMKFFGLAHESQAKSQPSPPKNS